MMRWLWLTMTLLVSSVAAQIPGGSDGESQSWFMNTPDSSKYMLIIAGPGASDEISDRFSRWAFSLQDTLTAEYAYPNENITVLIGDGFAAQRNSSRVAGSSSREDIARQIERLQQQTTAGDQITILLIGHGSGSATSTEAKFNNAGPDITGSDFAEMLSGFSGQDLVIINASSAGFEFTRELAGLGRVLVSATRSRAERFDPVFPEYFIEALQDRQGDRDKNNRVSVLEAFLYARQLVEAWYQEQGRLATEHPVLDDSGDGQFALEPGTEAADGRLAEIAYFDTLTATAEKQSPAAREILAEMQALERDVFLLRSRKTEYLEQDYWNRLEALLIELALKTESYHALP